MYPLTRNCLATNDIQFYIPPPHPVAFPLF